MNGHLENFFFLLQFDQYLQYIEGVKWMVDHQVAYHQENICGILLDKTWDKMYTLTMYTPIKNCWRFTFRIHI